MSKPAIDVSRLGRFVLARRIGGLFKLDEHGEKIRITLGSRALDVLSALVERQGEFVSKKALMDIVWPNTRVEENNLTVHISALRRALDVDRISGSCIQTIPGRGYRFLAPVDQFKNGDCHAGNSLTIEADERSPLPDSGSGKSLSLAGRPSIAVLPFTNMSDENEEYFSDGVADDILSQLARDKSLFVIARSSSFQFKGRSVGAREVGRQLGVRYILEGSVRRDGSRIRINVQLVNAETEKYMWSRRCDSELPLVFDVHNEIAQAVASELAPVIAHAETERVLRKAPATLSAWEAYQRGLWHMWRQVSAEDLELAGSFFHRAVELDPLSAEARAMLARYFVAADPGRSEHSYSDRLKKAEREARTALRLDSENAAAHSTLGLILTNRHGISAQSLGHAERAIELNANDPSGYFVKGHVLAFDHRADAAREALNAALKLDPLGRIAVGAAHHITVSFFAECDYAAAAASAKQTIRDHPHWLRVYPYLISSLGHLNRKDEARLALREAAFLAPDFLAFRSQVRPPFCRPEDHERLLEGLRKAGWKAG